MAVTRRPGNGRHLLLLAALLFGIVTMHTLGHPTAHASSPTTGHSTSAATDHSPNHPSQPPSHHPSGPEQAAAQHGMSASDAAPPGRAEVTGPVRAATAVGAPAGMAGVDGVDGMDPLSVCLAVLAALTLVLLLKAGLLRPGGFAVPARPLARLLDGLRPNPPPPRILLSHLSVLRI
ncbi:hypothetical protein [Streptomyces sp. NPDC051214]|uniref:hypothetical protein n=1 Tax=Streptomyces sp. NPDC051214 TaxID=3155282 RepID=UPI003441DA86